MRCGPRIGRLLWWHHHSDLLISDGHSRHAESSPPGLLGATIVRRIIVPATMTLFDRKAWWLPKWLQWIPGLDVEGPKLLEHLEEQEGAAPIREPAA